MGKKTIARFTTDTATAVSAGANSNIAFTNATISTNAIEYNSITGQIYIKCPGVYMIYANFTPVATVVGKVNVVMEENGNVVPGATATTTLAAVGDAGNLSFNAVTSVVKTNTAGYATITFVNTVATSYTAANVIIEKVA